MAKRRQLRKKAVEHEPIESSNSEAEKPIVEDEQLGADYSDDDVSDRELQAAFEDGLLDDGIVRVGNDEPRAPINKKEELSRKLLQIKKQLPWEGTLDVTFDPELCISDEQNDLEREATIYKQAFDAVHKAIPRLEKAGIPIFRPDDYFADMSKSDSHMQRVRERLLEVQKDKEQSENARRLREEKKFAQKAQTAAIQQKQQNKRKLAEAVKSHRKGMKAQLEAMLNNANEMENEEVRERKGKKITRTQRNKKYGFGGQKKRSKMNTRDSLNMMGSRPVKSGRVQKRRR